ncbi:hypothetical protein HOLleu_04740 [Holothuria leucospilota]|uniref:Uncharacterized protein n=1 Tax=Holothuria leucospilota TaxID=206669 RepID=A0A9Q1HHN5_HOLLE|nr:hypothetical protein HOLleu_04740 [Holothuria leucospilota]
MWNNYVQYPKQCYLVHYNHDGSQVLTTRKLDGDAEVVTAVETWEDGKIHPLASQRVYFCGEEEGNFPCLQGN